MEVEKTVKPTLELIERVSCLDGLRLYEPVCGLLLTTLIECVQFLPGTKSGDRTTKPQLEKYKEGVKRSDRVNAVCVTYKRKMAFGRCPSSGGLHNMKREIKQTLARDRFVDIDIENAHPVILHQICLAHSLSCPFLTRLVTKREEVLEEIIREYSLGEGGRSQAKQLFLILIYGGSFSGWAAHFGLTKGATDFISSLRSEICRITKLIRTHNKPIEDAIIAQGRKKEINLGASVLSLFLQEYECRILECIYTYCIKERVIREGVAVLCADGLMLEREFYERELLGKLSDEVFQSLGLRVNLVEKEMNDYYSDEVITHCLLSRSVVNK